MNYKNSINLKSLLFSGALVGVMATSCVTSETETTNQDETTQEEVVPQDSSKTRVIPAANKVFSIPSPLQLSLLIQETGAVYDQGILHDIASTKNYLDETKMALNMGVYGADLGYTAIYKQNTDAIGYMKAVKQLSDKLGISEAFDNTVIEQIESDLNNGNKDALLKTISNSYRKTDAYLKENKRQHVGALVLAGGWIESVYFTTRINEVEKNGDVRARIGEQRKGLDNILNILVKYYRKPGVDVIYNELEELYTIFDDEVKISYTYQKPEVDVENRHTVIKSETHVDFTPETYKKICDKVAEIRQMIIQ
jgi:hypothetical protein